MIHILLFCATALFACLVGRICGLGGGVIIKPVLDSFGVLSVASISFLSSCTVLVMTAWSVGKSFAKKDVELEVPITLSLALGSLFGGIWGKQLFTAVKGLFADADTVGMVQSLVLIAMLLLSLCYTLRRERFPSCRVKSLPLSVLVGAALGLISAFIGGGSGPINMVILALLFSMPTKVAAVNSLFIILPAQLSAIAQTLWSHSVPELYPPLLIGMGLCAVLGSELGRLVNRKISDRGVTRLFVLLMLALLAVNVYNAVQYF